MSGLIPAFTISGLLGTVDKFAKERERQHFEILSYVGIECVNWAKNNHGYDDQSGNLTSSIGYAIIVDGNVKSSKFTGETVTSDIDGGNKKTKRMKTSREGKAYGRIAVQEIAGEFPTGMVLVVVAGMEYAAAVESKGYDVISGSSYECEELMDYMSTHLGEFLS